MSLNTENRLMDTRGDKGQGVNKKAEGIRSTN